MKRLALVHPCLFAVAPILFLCAHNVSQVDPGMVALSCTIALIFAATLFGLFYALLRDAIRAAAASSIALTLFYLYGHFFGWVVATGWISAGNLHPLLALAWLALLAGGTAYVVRTPRDLVPFSAWLTGTAALLVLFSTASLIGPARSSGSIRSGARVTDAVDRDRYPRAEPLKTDSARTPDVYYIILDGYARGDVLERVYGFDNSDFLDGLRRRGFTVADRSCANYPMTFLSLASTLNMCTLDGVAQQMEPTDRARRPYYRMIRDPLVGRIFQSKGYRVVHFNTNWGGTEVSEIADLTYAAFPRWMRSEFVTVLIRGSALRAFEPHIADAHLYQFDRVPRVARIPGPTFTFVHMLVPHNPYVFDRAGNVRHDIPLNLQWKEKTGGWGDRRAYIDQLVFVNGQVLGMIDRIKADSSVPPVIILQSDHGSASMHVDEEAGPQRHAAFVRERAPILNAYLVPDRVRARLYPDITPINTFPILLSELFGEELPLRPDHVYFSWYRRPNDLRDVTGLVAGPADADAVRPALSEVETE